MGFFDWLKDSSEKEKLKECLTEKNEAFKGLNALRARLELQAKKINELIQEKNLKEKEIKDLEKQLKEARENRKPTRYPEASITYQRPVLVGKDEWMKTDIDVKLFIQPHDFHILADLKANKLQVTNENFDAIVPKVYRLAKARYSYGSDNQFGFSEFWMFPFELMKLKELNGSGDCIAENEEIYTKEGVKKIKDLKEGELILSYDWQKKEMCYKPITKIWRKGRKKIKRVHFRNGQTIDVTENTPMWVRANAKKAVYEKKYLSEIDLSCWWKRKVPVARKNQESFPAKNYGWPNLSETSISFIEDLNEEQETYDIQIADTQTFFFKNGICAHNCDDWAILIASYLRAAGVPENRVLVSAGNTRNGIGHATVYVKDSNGVWRHMNSTSGAFFDDLKKFPDKDDGKDRIGLKYFWFSFNDVFSISKFVSEKSELTFNESSLKEKIKIKEG